MKGRRNPRWEDMDKRRIGLDQLIQHFEIFNRSEGKSPKTVKWYSDVLNLFLHWLESEGMSTEIGAVGEVEVRSFVLHLRERKVNGKPLSTHTIANRVRGLKGFFSWLAAKRYTEENVLTNLRLPKTTQIVIEPLNPEEVKLIFSNINEDTALGARNAAIMALFLDTGLRLSEVVSLNEEDVHLDQRYVKVMGKGAKERIVPVGASCQKALLHYYHHFRMEPAHARVDSFFLTLDGYPMTTEAVTSVMDRLAKKTGLKRLHPHLLRHTYATHFLLNGGDVFLLKQNLGHSTLAMVEHYRHIASRQAAVMSETFSPLDRIDLKKFRRSCRNHNGNYGAIYPNVGHRSRPTLLRELAGAEQAKSEIDGKR
ncbi:MAG: tyrosine-type recombinase/integrase [Dehalococcoidia bacterium]